MKKPEDNSPLLVVRGRNKDGSRIRLSIDDIASMNPIPSDQCCICCGELGGDGHGHNASPVADGRCCGTCNDYAVIPARIANLYRAEGRPVRD
jgi:hypothetical protein